MLEKEDPNPGKVLDAHQHGENSCWLRPVDGGQKRSNRSLGDAQLSVKELHRQRHVLALRRSHFG